jgi:SAM-dependent methyltransferase
MQLSWDERYNTPDYVYGKEPNLYFQSFIDSRPPGRILLPGEGEGRNAVYAARSGWTVDACDQSTVARDKALRLASEAGVVIHYSIADLLQWNIPEHTYDAIGLIFIHKSSADRALFYPGLIRGLKPGGFLVLESFSKKQLRNASGGPQDPEMLFSREELERDFRGLEILELYELEQELSEGLLHTGRADSIRMTARKPI